MQLQGSCHCGSALWLYDPTWPELVHPHASAIDTLQVPPEHVHMMLGSKASWAEVEGNAKDTPLQRIPRPVAEGLARVTRLDGGLTDRPVRLPRAGLQRPPPPRDIQQRAEVAASSG